ncbi:MAG: plasmid recombination protein [Bacteroidetes bacterium]|nr:plasmid recombination protein [Bacteroidota bacterium]
MSFVVARMVKIKSHDVKGIQFHNQREKESRTNPDIDPANRHLNYDLVNAEKIDYNKRVKEIIGSQKIGERKTRKDAVLVNELLITSDTVFFDKLTPDKQKQFFEESYTLFSERYGKQNVAYAAVHNDERTPHLHLGIVPMRDGKLQGKNIFNRQELLWIQDEFPKHMQKCGFDIERGEKGSKREHIETQKFKADTLDQQVKDLETKLQDVTKVYEVEQQVDSIPVKDKRDLKAKMGLNGARTIEISSEDYETIKSLAKGSEGLKRENKGLLRDVEKLEGRIDMLKQRNSTLVEQKKRLMDENSKLKSSIKAYETLVDYLKQTLEAIKMNSIKGLDVAKEKMQSYVGQVRVAIMVKQFGRDVLKKEHFDRHVPNDERPGAEKMREGLQQQREDEKSIDSRKKEDLDLER